ncbi:hypothetical protein BJ138DRAFT_1113354 [Hygrophoropsis aurantiaca]|uniref:Uncharacterized protein n=1 Tax=Hygrophoropsis aurantiaca TaxID=72124 RepID=A0ACB8AEG6_9AGAM|nr:hypothetical protein BJ138DRAFT_1113354 [Hygrophoropsis aurantiaca]
MAPNLLNVPSELIENILVSLAQFDCPLAIAALSQTNKQFFDLVYRSPDQHLWREIFLATYDDPRPALSLHSPGANQPNHGDSFRWAHEYQTRSQGERINRKARVMRILESPKDADATTNLSRSDQEAQRTIPPTPLAVVEALLSIILTSSPVPGSMVSSLTAGVPSLQDAPLSPSLGRFLGPEIVKNLEGLNVHRLQRSLEFGFPPELTRILFANISIDVEECPPFTPGPTPSSYWDKYEQAQLFHKLVFLTGFRPIPKPLQDASSSDPIVTYLTGDSDNIPSTTAIFPSAQAQFIQARILARRRVYDMRYLSPKRMWGPYMPIKRPEKLERSARPTRIIDQSRTEDDEADQLWEDVDEDVEEELDDDFLSIILLIRGPDATVMPLNPPVQPYELTPDYTWLAAARIVVEARLKDGITGLSWDQLIPSQSIVKTLRSMHALRVGSAPGYLNILQERREKGKLADDTGKGKSKEADVEGWDWAGVTGIWRRCVCWLGYQTLLMNNLSPERFLEENMNEVSRVMPTALRVARYSEAPLPPNNSPTDPRLPPVIHFEGESIGTDTSLNDLRKVTGTVGVIGDGAVRWTMEFTVPGSDEPLWSSEGIQIGPPGSACGILGMWTGAQHERRDPLGPFWMWKVA